MKENKARFTLIPERAKFLKFRLPIIVLIYSHPPTTERGFSYVLKDGRYLFSKLISKWFDIRYSCIIKSDYLMSNTLSLPYCDLSMIDYLVA